ncbi:hypothetical protein HPB50_008160 [Hyalomma asiaticum]|uniref:Uncharacterized protein n=1 Tax=Hyalomma asiaticum TaxID=266040 RepID=A0ACB7T8X6_HYAAI|nr:hypothetical protein HPB50_008160 [Hyalomma asiaticum]
MKGQAPASDRWPSPGRSVQYPDILEALRGFAAQATSGVRETWPPAADILETVYCCGVKELQGLPGSAAVSAGLGLGDGLRCLQHLDVGRHGSRQPGQLLHRQAQVSHRPAEKADDVRSCLREVVAVLKTEREQQVPPTRVSHCALAWNLILPRRHPSMKGNTGQITPVILRPACVVEQPCDIGVLTDPSVPFMHLELAGEHDMVSRVVPPVFRPLIESSLQIVAFT